MTDRDVDPRIASWLRQDAPPAAAPWLSPAILAATRDTRQRVSRPGWRGAPLLLAGVGAVLLLAIALGAWWRSPDRLGPEPTPMASPSTPVVVSPAPSRSPEALESQALDADVLNAAEIANVDGASDLAGARPRDVVVGGPGLVAVGEMTPCCFDPDYDETWEAAIWTSRDGRRWELLPDLDTFGKAGFRAVAANENGLMMAAGYEVLPLEDDPDGAKFVTEARLWRSENGVDWTRAAAPEGDVHDIAAWRNGWITVGTRDDEAIVAISEDGETWTAHVIGPGAAERVAVDTAGTIVVAGCLLASEAVAGGCEGGLATSPDGVNWRQERVDGFVRGIAVGPDGGFVAVGVTDGGSTAWASPDGITWESATYEGSAADGFTAISVDRNGLTAAEAPLDAREPGRIWQSFDGRSWTLMFELEATTTQETTVTALAFRDAQYVVLGTGLTDALVPLAWHGP